MIKQMVSFTEPQYHALQNYAAELGITFAELVRRIIDMYRIEFGLKGEDEMDFTKLTPTVEIWVENEQGRMVQARTYQKNGSFYTEGVQDRRYFVRVINPTMGRIEVVASVDGLDILNGKPASVGGGGFVIRPRSQYDFEGFRVSNEQVAAFRFGSVESGYAASKGDTSNVGIIGVALYQEMEDSYTITHRETEISFGSRDRWKEPVYRGLKGLSKGLESRGSVSSMGTLFGDVTCQIPEASGMEETTSSPALATKFGEAITSKVGTTSFKRRTPTPWAVHTIRYESRENLVKLGIVPEDTELQEREKATPFPASPQFCEPPEGWGEDVVKKVKKMPVSRYGGPF